MLASSLITRASTPRGDFLPVVADGYNIMAWWPAQPQLTKTFDPETGDLHQFMSPLGDGALVVQLTLYPDSIRLCDAGEQAQSALLELEMKAMEEHGSYGSGSPRQLRLQGRLGLQFAGINRSRFLACRIYVDAAQQRIIRCLAEMPHVEAARPEIRAFLDSFAFA